MPYDASGVYARLINSFSQPVVGTQISPTDADSFFDDIDAALNAYYGTSTTSLAIGTGSKVFTTQADKLFGVGRYVIAASAADPANFMFGRVTAYSGTSLTVTITSFGGSGTHADWTIYIAGGPGEMGATGASYAGTSTSSQSIGNSGTKTFTTQAGLAYQVGTRIRAADVSNPTANWMEGVVTSYSSTTLVFTADKSLGSGTLTDWTLSVAGQFGADGAGTGDVSGPASSVDGELALFNLTTGKLVKRASMTGLVKAASGVASAAVAGTDYLAPPSGSAMLKANSGGALANATDGTDYLSPSTGIKQGLHTVPLPASCWKSRATNGAEQATYDSGANDVTLPCFNFDTSAQEYIHSIPIRMPKSWNEGTVTFEIAWTNAGGSAAQTVRWTVAGRALGNDDAINGSFGTAVNLDDTWLAQNDLHSILSSAVTIGNSPAEGDYVVFEISRDVANDNMSGDAVFLEATMFLTLNAASDD